MKLIKDAFALPEMFVRGVIAFLAAQWRQFTPMGQALFAVAVVMVLVDATISFKFGLTQTWVHAVGFAGLAFAFFLLPDAAISEARKRNWGGCVGLTIACVPIFGVCLWTHVGYSSGVRLGDIEQSGFKHAAFESADKVLNDKRQTLALLRSQLADVQTKAKAAAEKNQGWIVSVDPVAMQSSLDAMDSQIANEAKRVRCGARCDELKAKRGILAAAIDLAKKENGLTEQIQTLGKEIDAKAKEVAALAPQTSNTVSQIQMAAKLVNVGAYYLGAGSEEAILKPSAFQMDLANTAAAGFSSFAFLLVGTTLMMGAGFNRKPGALTGEHDPVSSEPSGNRTPTAPSASLSPVRREVEVRKTVNMFLDPFVGKALTHNAAA